MLCIPTAASKELYREEERRMHTRRLGVGMRRSGLELRTDVRTAPGSKARHLTGLLDSW